MRAATRLGARVSKIAMYEPPYNSDPGPQQSWSQYLRQLSEALAEGRQDAGYDHAAILGELWSCRPSWPRVSR